MVNNEKSRRIFLAAFFIISYTTLRFKTVSLLVFAFET
jgi:hypothetical protein